MNAAPDALLSRLRAPLPRLADRLGRERDNVLALRHLAAALVIFSHSYALTVTGPSIHEPLSRLLPGLDSGRLALHVFFLLSGLLVTTSWLRHPRLLRFAGARVLRVMPGYLACLGLSVALLGPLVSELDATSYFAHPDTLRHLVSNLDVQGLVWTLPGVFAVNPYPDVVNGSLWSLALEVKLYLYLLVLAAIGVLSRRWAATPLLVALLALSSWEWWVGLPDAQHYRALTATFVAGMLMALHPRLVPVSGRVLVLLAALAAATAQYDISAPLRLVALLYGVLWLAFRLPRLPFPRADLSYGIFLYGFPVQQTVLLALPLLSPLALTALALPLAALLALASWRLIEKPALGLVRRFDASRGEPAASVRIPPAV